MRYIQRKLEFCIRAALDRGKSVLLFGARQTGKTTLIERINADIYINFANPRTRRYFEINPDAIISNVEATAEKIARKPLLIVDEAQKVPEIFDAAQYLIDKKIAQFILTGSSARKLKTTKINLLPGRVVILQLYPLILNELKDIIDGSLEDFLLYGSLPGIVNTSNKTDKTLDLISYVDIYLEEEIRTEAMVRNVGNFARFLNLAASESGNLISMRKLSQEIGVAHTTVNDYYQILEDCLVAEKIEAFTSSKVRRQLSKMPKYLFYDLGLRRICAEEGTKLPKKYLGFLFEQFIGLELVRCLSLISQQTKLMYFRDKNGIEVDWIIKIDSNYIPIEVKWTERPILQDARHLQYFLHEYDCNVGYVVCRCPQRLKLSANIYAIPWQEIDDLVFESNLIDQNS